MCVNTCSQRWQFYSACAQLSLFGVCCGVLFLRHEDPFIFMKQGGDLDGRNQCLTSN
jgi:hypothetical protein